MNIKFNNFMKNLFYTFTSNLLSFLVSTLVVVFVPKMIGVEEYGYWQLYLFYASYVSFMHFGWSDGIYLRIGGKDYKDLDKKTIFSQFYMLTAMQITFSVFIIVLGTNLINDKNKIFIIGITALTMVITNIRSVPVFILQATNRIKEFAQITILDKIVYFLLIVIALIIGIKDFRLLIITDLVGRTISLVYAIYCCKDIIMLSIKDFRFTFKEAWENISVGIKLMLAYIAGLLIIGIVRFGIELAWDVETFGKVSLTLSASNLMMLFINAVGIIMFPILRRIDEKKLPGIYTSMRDFLMFVLLGLLIVYYPIKTLLSSWLPIYSESLTYMALVFPMFIFEGKMALLINTYLKTMRKEKLMLRVNLIALGLSFILTFITTKVLEDLDLAIASIVFLLAFKSVLAEILLSKILKVSVYKEIVSELALTFIFIFSGWFINSWYTVLVYGLSYFIYLFMKKKDISNTIQIIKTLIRT